MTTPTVSLTENLLAKSADEPLFQSPADVMKLWDQSLHWLLHHWLQIAIASGIGALLVLALLGIRLLGAKICERRGASGWMIVIGRVVTRTSFFFMVMVAARLVSGYARPPEMVASTIEVVWTVTSIVQAALWVRELMIGAIEIRTGDTDSSALGSAIGIIRLLVTALVFAIATVVTLDNLGINVTGLVAGLGIGGIAIGLAAKGIFDDLFSALSIIFDRPFRRGETIKWDNTIGTVEAIGLKTTRIRANTGEEVVISNTNLLHKELHNLAKANHKRVSFTLGVTYETPQDKLEALPDIGRRVVEAEQGCRLFRCGLTGFGASSIDYELTFDVDVAVQGDGPAKQAVGMAILRALAEEGIGLAYPTQVSYVAAPGGKLIMPWPEPATATPASEPASTTDDAEPSR